jgi:DNA-binding NarL/FixJ family response regulator
MAVTEAADANALLMPAAHGAPVSRVDLGELNSRMRADCVALVRFVRDTARFELVAVTGVPFLAPGIRLPMKVSRLVLEASEGRMAYRSPEHSARPLDSMAVSLGLGCGVAIPLKVSGMPIGAVTVWWRSSAPAVRDPRAIVRGSEAALIGYLFAPDVQGHRVLVCHEDRLTAEGLAHIVEQRLGATVDIAAEPSCAVQLLNRQRVAVLLCSDHFSIGEPPDRFVGRLRAAGTAAPLVIVARRDSSQAFEAASRAGAAGYLPVAAATQRLSHVVAMVMAGRTALHPVATMTAERTARLTSREQEVLACFERGLCDKEIATQLNVALSTVKTHARSIYSKLHVASRTAAVHRARVLGLI